MSDPTSTMTPQPMGDDVSRHRHRRMNTAIAIAMVIAVVALLLRSCTSDGSKWLWSADSCANTITTVTGPPGATGATGPAGSTGPAGTCTTAYQQWIGLGYRGTVTDFLNWLKGARGAKGDVGAVGPQGAQGLMGLTGASGPIGPTGVAGPQGPTGLTGATGPAGATGAAGPTGATGPQGPAGTSGMGDAGSFWDLTQQGDDGPGGYLPDTAYPIQLGVSDPDNVGISMTAGNQITFTHPGTYNIAFSAQISRSQGGASSNISIWLAKNGTNVPDTNTDFTLQSNAQRYVAAWNFFVPVTCTTSCDTYQLMWSAESEYSALVYIPAQTAPVRPAIPSVILTVNQVR